MAASASLLFPPFRLDLGGEQLWCDRQAIALRPKTFAVLRYLAEHPGQLASKDELLDAVWGETAVSESVLKTCVRELREALGDDARTPQFVETVHRRGYRFRAAVRLVGRVHGDLRGSPIPSARHPAAALVGREVELAELRALSDKAEHGERQIVFVSGEPGIGKTALVDEFLKGPLAPALIGRGQCIEQYGTGEAYLPILEALARLCRGPEGERLMALLDQHAPTWLAQMAGLLDAADLEAVQRKVARATREGMLREMAEALEVLSAEQTLVLWLEDLHWSDVSTLELLAMLGRRRERARLLVIGSYRPVDVIVRGHPLREVKHELELHGQCAELRLRLLTEAAVAEFVALRFAGAGDSAPFRQLAHAIHARTEGNPLFMVNVVNDLITRDAVADVGGQWVLRGAAEEVAAAVPDSMRQMIEWQLERLGAADRRVLEVASVAGMEFSAAAVAAGMEATLEDVEERCTGLARREQFLRAQGRDEWPDATVAGRYGFAHALFQEVTYARLPAGRGAQLHHRIGERVELAYGARASEIAAQLAVHFERGRDPERAVRYLRRAAETAIGRGSHRGAIDHLTKEIALLAAMPETAETAALGLEARARIVSLGWRSVLGEETVAGMVAEGRDLAARGGDPRWLARLVISYGTIRGLQGDLEAYRAAAEEVAAMERATPDVALRVGGVLMSFAGIHWWTANLRELEPIVDEMLELMRADPLVGNDVKSLATYPHALMIQAELFYFAGRFAEAQQGYERAAAAARAVEAAEHSAYIASEHACFEGFRGDARSALALATGAVRLAETLGIPFGLERAYGGLGSAHAAAERWREAADALEHVLAITRDTGVGLNYQASALAPLSVVYLGGGDPDRARATAEEAIAAAERYGVRLYGIDANLALVRALLGCEGVAARPAIERALARAAALIDDTGARSRIPCVHRVRAELAGALGDEVARRRELRRAQRLFGAMGAPIRAAEVARELERRP